MSEFLQGGKPPLILASSSKVRARLLEAAGLAFTVQPPGLDEHIMRHAEPSIITANSAISTPAGTAADIRPPT